jgi:ferric-dicitrate binding protein FerR (iron transport regulator)
MLDKNHIERISQLIGRHILGQLSDDELQELDDWRHRSPQNEDVYRHLVDAAFLSLEYRRREMINSDRACDEMQLRINRKYGSSKNKYLKTVSIAFASVAAVLALALFLSPLLFRENKSNTHIEAVVADAAPIVAGSTKAALTLANGQKVMLGNDDSHNLTAIRNAKEKTGSVSRNLNLLSTPKGGEFKVTLEDGTVVWLNAQSRLYYPDSFDGDERRVKVEGEAYFKVAKNEKRPFFVETAGQMVRVYGTEFNINSYGENKSVYTTLVNGKISLYPIESPKAELILTPGNQAIFSKRDASTSVHRVDPEVMTSWRNGKFVFEEQTLEQIMQTLSRWYDFTFEFKNNSIAATEFAGSMSRYSNFNDVLKILEQSGNLKFKVSGHHVVVYSK